MVPHMRIGCVIPSDVNTGPSFLRVPVWCYTGKPQGQQPFLGVPYFKTRPHLGGDQDSWPQNDHG